MNHGLNCWTTASRRRGLSHLAAGLLLLLWAITVALAAAPELHRFLHRDAQDANHYCLLTQVSRGSLFSGPTQVDLPMPAVPCVGAPHRSEAPMPSRRDHELSPSRAPPAAPGLTRLVG